jgi:hypothetical protein
MSVSLAEEQTHQNGARFVLSSYRPWPVLIIRFHRDLLGRRHFATLAVYDGRSETRNAIKVMENLTVQIQVRRKRERRRVEVLEGVVSGWVRMKMVLECSNIPAFSSWHFCDLWFSSLFSLVVVTGLAF